MRFKYVVSSVIFFLLSLISCSSQSIVVQTSTSTVKPIITNLPKPIATINSTATPSPTLSPAQETEAVIHARVIKADQTQQAFMFTSAPATLEARNVKCKDGFVLEQCLDVIRVSNDKWTLFTCSPLPKNKDKQWTPGIDDYGTRYTQITKTDLSQTWVITHNTFDYSIINRPDALLSPFKWTADGKYLYLYPRYYPGGSGFPQSYFLYTYINDLYRINLETGEFKLFLKTEQFGDLAFSPNDQLLIYSDGKKPDVIHVRNIETDNDLEIKLNENVVATGAFIWNPESTKVVFFVGYDKQSDDWQDDLSCTAIFVLTLQNMHVQKVLAKDVRIFEPYGCSDDHNVWLDENTICLYSVNEKLDSWNKFFAFNIKTGAVKFLRPFP
jgi:hypothetical protein